MLAFEYFISRRDPEDPSKEILLARWMASCDSIEWINKLVEQGKATCLSYDGYPCKFTATASVIREALGGGPPKGRGGWIFAEEGSYALPPGWTDDPRMDKNKFAECPDDEVLDIEAWDQS